MNTESNLHTTAKRINKNQDSLPKAAAANYDPYTKRLNLALESGVNISIPIRLIFGVQAADDEALEDFSLMLKGLQIHWHTLDQQFYIKSILEGALVNQ